MTIVCLLTVISRILESSRENKNPDYISLYREFLLENRMKFSREYFLDRFGLAYIDGDDIPELFVTSGSGGTDVRIYTVRDGKITEAGVLPGYYGGFAYGENTGWYVFLSYRQYGWACAFYKMNNGRFEEKLYGLSVCLDAMMAVRLSYGTEAEEKFLQTTGWMDSTADITFEEETQMVYNFIRDGGLDPDKFGYLPRDGWYWSDFTCRLDGGEEQLLSYDEFITEYQKYLPEKLVDYQASQGPLMGANYTETCGDYKLNEDTIREVLK